MGKATWLEVYKADGEWKIADGRTNRVLRTEPTKRDAENMTRSFLGTSEGGNTYVSAQFYRTNGGRGQRIVNSDAVKYWTRSKSTRR